ncbi:MAG: 16S rRNA processing protein RimM [Candidatus Marinimicrobia bacterium]|nr:16S rRNA processing protein RimM [Candidatus Neomarinimicrobiota bacterium]
MHFKPIGKILKTHGLEGRLFIIVKNLDNDFVRSLKYLFFGTGETGPDDVLQLESIQSHKNGYLIKAENVNHISDAEKFINTILFLSEDDIPDIEEIETPDFNNYRILDTDSKKELGKFQALESYPGHDMLVVITGNGKELLIPFVDAFVQSIDHESKTISVQSIEGLLDAN